MALEMWLEAVIFILLLFLVNAVILLASWFSLALISSDKSKDKDPLKKFMDLNEKHSAKGVGVGPDLLVAEALGSGRHKHPHHPPNFNKRWSSSRVSDLEDSSSEAEAHMTTALSAHFPNRNDDVRCALAMEQNRKTMEAKRMSEEAWLARNEERRISKQIEDSQVILRQRRSSRLSALLEGFIDVNICVASELQKLVEQETEEFKHELRAINLNLGVKQTADLKLLGKKDAEAENPEQSSQSDAIEYRRYNALVPVGRFDADYRKMGQPGEQASEGKESPGQKQ